MIECLLCAKRIDSSGRSSGKLTPGSLAQAVKTLHRAPSSSPKDTGISEPDLEYDQIVVSPSSTSCIRCSLVEHAGKEEL